VSELFIQTLKKMETQTIASLEKNALETSEVAASCCTQPANESACCTPSTSKEENNGACCAQPADGSSCCDK